ncbi:RNA-binding protein [Psychrobium sp. 1_MG-2023]|uniref:RNA recognition motif domain-containing protein n=1 Tax=Psychrobium sp. 1_MG-2023 TaxID=3062624 RepID=UPI000C334382|nr:RNA-binding protein [Psychrobium sp. 1_MG-2023]MDP2562268.1 RNA-binding protein [Psychrobium sp. 1_MG-2023]PKF54652.1 RNA-binding protein [Alteromonadales bacterium alter-6D02]
MKSNKFTPLLITFVLAVVGFFVLPLIAPSMESASVVFAIGIALGGTTVALLSPSAATSSATTSSAAVADDDRQTLYVGNLPYRANESVVRELFESHGPVFSVRLVKDKQTGRRRGFGFVTMNGEGAAQAMAELNEQEFQERILKVREAKEKTSPENTSQVDG